MLWCLSYPFHIQISHAQSTGFFDINSVNSHKSIRNGLAAVGRYGVAHAVAWHIHRHSFFHTDAAGLFRVLYCDSVKHIMFFLCLQVPPRLALYLLVMTQEKRETRFCQVHQAVGIAKHPSRMNRRTNIPRLPVIKSVIQTPIDFKTKGEHRSSFP